MYRPLSCPRKLLIIEVTTKAKEAQPSIISYFKDPENRVRNGKNGGAGRIILAVYTYNVFNLPRIGQKTG